MYTREQHFDRCNAVSEINPNAIFNCEDGVFTWLDDTTPISDADIDAKVEEMKTAKANEEQAQADLKASAKAKLIAGEPLTEEEAETIVL